MKNSSLKARQELVYIFLFFSVFSLQPFLAGSRPAITFFTERNSPNGPGGVLRSTLAGMQALGISYNLNPSNLDAWAPVTVVLSNYDALRMVVQNREVAKVKAIIAGPNIDLLYDQSRIDFASSPVINGFLVPSDWTRVVWETLAPATESRLRVWYTGVDPQHWAPAAQEKPQKKILIYMKLVSGLSQDALIKMHSLHALALDLTRKYGFEPLAIAYGSFGQDYYKMLLEQSCCAIFLSHSESQGIALAEAWAMNVPTLVWNPKTHESSKYAGFEVSSAPYLTTTTGNDWQTAEELEALLSGLRNRLLTYSPRRWVLDNMTDAIAAQKLLDIITEVQNQQNLEFLEEHEDDKK